MKRRRTLALAALASALAYRPELIVLVEMNPLSMNKLGAEMVTWPTS